MICFPHCGLFFKINQSCLIRSLLTILKFQKKTKTSQDRKGFLTIYLLTCWNDLIRVFTEYWYLCLLKLQILLNLFKIQNYLLLGCLKIIKDFCCKCSTILTPDDPLCLCSFSRLILTCQWKLTNNIFQMVNMG